MDKLNVFSAFDGISAGMTALNKLNIKPNKYFASEIEKSAIKISKKNWNNIIHLGDIKNIKYLDNILYKENEIIFSGKIDLLIGGSPCQSFSFAGKRKGMITKDNIEILNLDQYLDLKNQNFEFEGQSYLFWEYIRLLHEIKPKFFMLENVKMHTKWEGVLNQTIGFEPIMINSSLLSAQNRPRLYWVGKRFNNTYSKVSISQPKDKNIYLKDILENFEFQNISSMVGRRINKEGHREDYNKNIPLVQCLQVKKNNLKSGTITTVTKDNLLTNLPFGRYPLIIEGKKFGIYNEVIKDNKNNSLNLVGITADIKGNDQIKRVYGDSGKSPTLTTMQGGHQEPKVAINNYLYRKLTVKECARLQTFPDDYFDGFKDSPSYKGIGNSWTVDVIVHIFKEMKFI